MDASVKNNVASSIVHIHVYNKLIVKMIHHVINVMSTKAKFFAIRCGINQVFHLQDIFKIIVVTDSIHTAKKIFDPSSHLLQKQVALILNNLREFFNHHHENTVKFWECPSKSKWNLHKYVDIETKSFNLTPLLPAVIRRVCGQTLAKVRFSRYRTVVILLVYNGGRTCDLEVM